MKSGFDSREEQEMFLIVTTLRPDFRPIILRGVKRPRPEADHLHVMPRFVMSGAVPPLPHVRLWSRAQSRTGTELIHVCSTVTKDRAFWAIL
jgi:hypothetical protein